MYVWVCSPFLQPPVYCLLAWQCKMSARAMIISLFKTLRWFVEQRHATDCERRRRKGKKETHVQSDFVTRARCCSCSTFFPLQRKHTLIQATWETTCKCQNIALAWFMTVCLVLDCQNWVSLPLKAYSKIHPWWVGIMTQYNVEFSAKLQNKSPMNMFWTN